MSGATQDMTSYAVTTASVVGRDHARLFRNNQDGVAARLDGGVAVAVVTDGCGSGASSEVGARLGARYLAQVIPPLAREVGVGPVLAERACAALVEWMRSVVQPFAPLAATVQDQWLFTVLCAVMDAEKALVFGVGDGAWAADGVGVLLDAGLANAPDYLGYQLVPDAVEKGTVPLSGWKGGLSPFPVVHFVGAATTLLIATDGLTDLSVDEPLLWKNPFALERKLRVRAGHDDATVAILKRAA